MSILGRMAMAAAEGKLNARELARNYMELRRLEQRVSEVNQFHFLLKQRIAAFERSISPDVLRANLSLSAKLFAKEQFLAFERATLEVMETIQHEELELNALRMEIQKYLNSNCAFSESVKATYQTPAAFVKRTLLPLVEAISRLVPNSGRFVLKWNHSSDWPKAIRFFKEKDQAIGFEVVSGNTATLYGLTVMLVHSAAEKHFKLHDIGMWGALGSEPGLIFGGWSHKPKIKKKAIKFAKDTYSVA